MKDMQIEQLLCWSGMTGKDFDSLKAVKGSNFTPKIFNQAEH